MTGNMNNLVFFEGNLVSDPKLNTFTKTNRNSGQQSDESVVRFTLALSGGKDGDSKECAFVSAEAWSSAANVIADYKKGDRVAGFGVLRNNKWTVKETNEERKELVIRVSRFYEVDIKSRDCEYEEKKYVTAV